LLTLTHGAEAVAELHRVRKIVADIVA